MTDATTTTNGDGEIPSLADLMQDTTISAEIPAKKKRAAAKPTRDPAAIAAAGFFAEACREIVADEVSRLVPRKTILEITRNGETEKLETRQHYLFPLMVKIISAGVNVALVGPSQSGKTTAAINAAKVTGDGRFSVQSFSMATTKADIFGFIDATGGYKGTPFFHAFKEGFPFIVDEFDCCNPGIATLFNAAISNKVVTFPHGETIVAGDGFRVIACMNTAGTGATAQYVGRNRLDAATLARFVYLDVPYDDGLSASFAGVEKNSPDLDVEDGEIMSAEECFERYLKVRAGIEKAKLPHIITPRDVAHAVALSRAGIGARWVDRMVFARQMTPEQIKAVEVAA